jgi:hypothetical protein
MEYEIKHLGFRAVSLKRLRLLLKTEYTVLQYLEFIKSSQLLRLSTT